jgi:type IV fimbrial biogenesis protein FimT
MHTRIVHAGFTIVELLTVLVIAGILATLAAPALYDMILSNRLTSKTNEIVADLMVARTQAVTLGSRTVVCALDLGQYTGGTPTTRCKSGATSTDWTAGRIVFVDDDRDGSLDTGETVLKVSPPDEEVRKSGSVSSAKVTVSATNLVNTGRIDFSPTGVATVTGGTATFKLCDTQNRGRTVTVAASGRAGTNSTSVTCP